MRNFLTTLAVLAIFSAGGWTLWAQDAAPTTPEATPAVDAKAAAAEHAKLRVKLHRTIADLIEARFAEQPDQTRIDKLAQEVDQLQADLQSQRPGMQAGRRGPGRGPGMGYGRGPGYGRGYGRGPGMGPGPGGDNGGRGPGFGRGAGYIDQNQNGVCDRREPLSW